MNKFEFDELKSRQDFQKREWLKNYAFISDLWVEGARNQFEQDKKLVEELQAKLEVACQALRYYADKTNWRETDPNHRPGGCTYSQRISSRDSSSSDGSYNFSGGMLARKALSQLNDSESGVIKGYKDIIEDLIKGFERRLGSDFWSSPLGDKTRLALAKRRIG